ncbi:MAG: extensin family protein [Pseudomonadota bacterium]
MPGLMTLLRFLLKPPVLALVGITWILSNRRRRRVAALSIAGTVIGAVVLGELLLDHRHLPWRGLDVNDRAGLSTGLRLRALGLGPDGWCAEKLNTADALTLKPMDAWYGDKEGSESCGWPGAYHIESSAGRTLTGSSVYPMRCALTAGALIWINSADYHARRILGSELVRVHHAGTYSCRRMYGRSRGKMSQHAYANAWDVTGFELADGRIVSVLKDWSAGGDAQRFLRVVHRDACRTFNVVLGPDYNAAHRDHFHVDMGNGVICR